MKFGIILFILFSVNIGTADTCLDFLNLGFKSFRLPRVGGRLTIKPRNSGNPLLFIYPHNYENYVEEIDADIDWSRIKEGSTITNRKGEIYTIDEIASYGYGYFQKKAEKSDLNKSPKIAVKLKYKSVPSHVYDFKITQENGNVHSIIVAIPTLANGEPDTAGLERTKEGVSELPLRKIESLKVIRFNRERSIKLFEFNRPPKFAFVGQTLPMKTEVWNPVALTQYENEIRGTAIDFFPSFFLSRWIDLFKFIIKHEFGHALAININYFYDLERGNIPSVTAPQGYRRSKIADGNRRVSWLSSSDSEEWAELFRKYLDSDAGAKNPTLRKKFSARFSMLDHVFGLNDR